MTLQRTHYPMPEHIEQELHAWALMDAYLARPDYQQNGYIGWISHASRRETQEKRLMQMLEELADGTAYMNMPYNAKQ